LLDKYADAGIDSIEDLGILRVFSFSKFGTPVEIIKLFGGKDEFLAALQELETALYAVAWRASVPSPQFSFSGLDYK
jgi:type I restriction enzyme R subunit